MDKEQHFDQRYIQALKEQDSILCQKIYNVFLPKVIAMIKAKGGNEQEAKDVFQQAILAILLHLKTGDIVLTTSFSAYVKGIAYHKFIDLCRKHKKQLRNNKELRLSDETFIESAEVEQLLKKEKQLNLFWQCFKKLSGDCKSIIKGKLDGLNAQAIMQQLNFKKPTNAFYQKRFDCMRKLKEFIQQHPDYAMIKV